MEDWVRDQPFLTTAEIEIPPRLVDQVIGQDPAVEVIQKAAAQKRHVMLIGEPGTGKSMLARAMAEILPREELQDILVFHNPEDTNNPRVRAVPAGKGREIVTAHKLEAQKKRNERNQFLTMILAFVIIIAAVLSITPDGRGGVTINPMVLFFGIIAAAMLLMAFRWMGQKQESALVPKLLLSHSPDDKPPFVDATGAHAGALLGDVRHDPFQSGGLETPSHERVEAGAIHRAHKGVLFIDEINILRLESQQSLLTALQEKEFSIVGQSERSSGAMVRTEPVPCDFVLVAAGNLDAVEGMHPALRSRIRGYGYEIFMKNSMEDTHENREKLVRFIAQEVAKDRKIPHFDKSAVTVTLYEAQRRAGTRGHLTLRLRELGGLVRVAGDIAREKRSPLVTAEHVLAAKRIARTLEQQVADQLVEKKKEYKNYLTEGAEVGRVNGLGVLGGESGVSEHAGVVLPIVAEMTPARSRSQGEIIATGKLGEIAKEAVQNVSAIIKKYTGEDISNHDVHIQFIGTYEGVEGDSASISVATAVISAMEEVPVSQSAAMTGSLSVRGQVLPVGAITAKCEAAAEAGMKRVLIPAANARDVLLEDRYRDRIEVVLVEDIIDVLKSALAPGPRRDKLIEKLSAITPKSASSPARPPTGLPAPQG
ncbi:MAG: ATP-dependent protease LonB [Thermoplasmatota archaeon]